MDIHYGKAAYVNLEELSGHGTKLAAANQELTEAFNTLKQVFTGQSAAAVDEVHRQVVQNVEEWIARHDQQTRNAVDQHDAMHAADGAVGQDVLGSYARSGNGSNSNSSYT